SHPHDSKVFPDLPEHQDNPSQLRLQHDGLATDDKARLEPMCLAEYLISGPGGMDPDIEIDDDTYDECREVLSRILEDAYTQSGTYGRLIYDGATRKNKWLEGVLCGALSLCVTSALDVVGLPVSISPFVGGIIGFVGVDKLREIAISALKKRAGVNDENQ
ncbi:phage holin, lambda family, partial [Salmonella enterica subsp. enterica]